MDERIIRKAKVGDESGIHEAHMRSIREICVKDHGEEEIKGWGNGYPVSGFPMSLNFD
jgi:hypothetical protein